MKTTFDFSEKWKSVKTSLSVLAFFGAALLIIIVSQIKPPSDKAEELEKLKSVEKTKHIASVDHSGLTELNRRFSSPQEVTQTCISCHTERGDELLHSAHFLWEREEYLKGRGIVAVGKKNLLNNFCIGISGSEKSCNKCHAGYGWKDSSFDFSDPKNIDCLVCHDNSGEYIKANQGAGYPVENTDLTKCAQSVGLPKRTNCGNCHFYGGGGNNVKHGDLEEALFETNKEVDVHMGKDGMDFDCVKCHTAENHNIKGKMYSVSSMNRNRLLCEDCHGNSPHDKNIINEHTVKVACQTCHIPVYAKVNATKTYWDWSAAGRLKDGKPFEEDDSDGNHIYMSIKGSFQWGKNLKPDYAWFNGTANHYLLCDKIDTSKVVQINTLYGDSADRNSKIIPVKIHGGKQIYDSQYMWLIQPKLYADKPGEGGFWQDFDWNRAAQAGMDAVGKPYSGKYGFVQSEMYWPINHMVSPASESVACKECHTRNDGRLAGLQDFYMPGRNYSSAVDSLGIAMIIAVIAGVAVHGTVRIIFSYKKNRRSVE
jgi:octaheme c-type cytochrome (tetrathionate reductase family)